jgi:hypothetical protein
LAYFHRQKAELVPPNLRTNKNNGQKQLVVRPYNYAGKFAGREVRGARGGVVCVGRKRPTPRFKKLGKSGATMRSGGRVEGAGGVIGSTGKWTSGIIGDDLRGAALGSDAVGRDREEEAKK